MISPRVPQTPLQDPSQGIPPLQKHQNPRKIFLHVSACKIKKFYSQLNMYLKKTNHFLHNNKSVQIKKRWNEIRKDPKYKNPQVVKYGFFALKGMLVHEVLRALVSNIIPDLSAQVSTPTDLVNLCFALNWHAYYETISSLHNLRVNYPQIAVFDEMLVYSVMKDIRNVLGSILFEIDTLLTQGHSLGSILLNYTNIRLEKEGKIPYKNLIIHYRPDWVHIKPEGIYVLEFKAGYLQQGQFVNAQDRFQVILYAWCLSQRFRRPVKVAVFYTQSNQVWEAEFTKDMEQEVEHIVKQYIQAQQKKRSKKHSLNAEKVINTTSAVPSASGVCSSPLSAPPISRSIHPAS